jgi:hypothetical protein
MSIEIGTGSSKSPQPRKWNGTAKAEEPVACQSLSRAARRSPFETTFFHDYWTAKWNGSRQRRNYIKRQTEGAAK